MGDLIQRLQDQGLVTVVEMEPFFAATDDCCICGAEVILYQHQQNYALAMYEDRIVPDEWDGEWGGFTACKSCFDKNERGELTRWTVAQLEHMTRPNTTTGGKDG